MGCDYKRDALEIAEDNYKDYSKYVIATRAYPSLIDGCKAVARRCIHCSYKHLPRKKVKSVNAIGEIVKLHPHPNSIYGVLVGMASKYNCAFPLFDTKGNFGGMGNPPAAERYTELMISDLAIKIFESFSDYVDMQTGEMDTDEPVALATLLPLCFLHGTYGIPTGMSTVNIPPLNPIDLIKYYIEILKSGDLNTYPDLLVKPNVGDVLIESPEKDWKETLAVGNGRLKYQPRIEVDNKSIIIHELPPGREFSHIEKALSEELSRDQIDIRDETTNEYRYVVEILPYRRVNADSLLKKLEKKLSVYETYRFIFAEDGVAIHSGFHYAIKRNLEYTIKCCKRKFDNELKELEYKFNVLITIEKMKRDKNILRLFEMTNDEALKFITSAYGVSIDQAKSVLSKPLSYLTREHDKEITDIQKSIEETKNFNNDIYGYLLGIYKSLLNDVKKFMKDSSIKTTEFKKVRRK